MTKLAMILFACVGLSGFAEAGSGCLGPQTCMTPYGETMRGVFRSWPKGGAPINWKARDFQPINSPQNNVGRKKTR